MIKKFFFLLGKEHYFYASISFVLILIASFLEIIGIGAIPIFISYILDPSTILSKVPNFFENSVILSKIILSSKIDLIFYGSVFIFFIFLFKNIILLFSTFIETILFTKIKLNNGQRLMKYYLYLPYLYHSKKNSSELIRNMQVGVNNSASHVISFISLFKEFTLLSLIFLLLVSVSYKITIFSLLILIFSVLFYYQVIKKNMTIRGIKQNYYKKIDLKILRHALGSIKETKVYGIKSKFINLYKSNMKNQLTNHIYYKIIQSVPKILLEQVTIFIILSITLYLFFMGKNQNILPTLSLFTLASIRMIPGFNQISSLSASYKFRKASFDVVYKEFVKIEKLDLDKRNSEKISFKKEMQFKNVSFRHDQKKKNILKDINFKLKKNSMISFTGSSGSGKTTLLNIILGLIKPASGKTMIDKISHNLNNYNWHSKIGYVAQDVYLLDETIKNNIIFGRNKIKNEKNHLNNIIKTLSLQKLTNTLNDGIETVVGDNGSRISGGEKQRIGIARALYGKPDILIMDEATASLDYDSEEEIIKNLKKIKDMTIIIVSHRSIPIKYSNEVFELKNSKIFRKSNYEIK